VKAETQDRDLTVAELLAKLEQKGKKVQIVDGNTP
jgi:hypothetical protein